MSIIKMGFLDKFFLVFLFLSSVVYVNSKPSNNMDQEKEQQTLSQSINQFSSQFYKQTAAVNPGKNLVMSPLSAEIALALLSMGSRGSTLEELNTALYLPNENFTKSAFKTAMERLNAVEGVTLNVANKVYVKEGERYVMAPEFAKVAKEVFYSEAQNLNFANNVVAAKTINTWVEDKTNNRIKDLIKSDSLTDDTRMVLVNAIYFKGSWEKKFDPQRTSKGDFFVTKDNKIEVDMMHQTAHFNYADIPEWDAKILELPYEKKQMSMIIILPNQIDGLAKVEEKLAAGGLNDVINRMYDVEVIVSLPKFKIETEMDLKKILPEMGIKKIFEGGDLSGLLKSGEPLFVSEAIQKAFIEVNEEGAEAAAATGFAIMCRMMPIRMEFNAEHPFYYAILSDKSPVFVGKVSNFAE